MSYAPVSREGHAGKAWLRYTSYRFAAGQALAPVVAAELLKAAPVLPLAFVDDGTALSLVAVLSLDPGRNLFVAPDGRWLGGYIPAVIRGYPFALAHPAGAAAPILCVDSTSLVEAGTAGAEPLIDEDGGLAPAAKAVLDFLGQIETSRLATARAVAELGRAGVLSEWQIQLNTSDGPRPVTGLLRVDEARLAALEDEAFLRLRAAGALPIAYAQMLSTGHLGAFERLARLQEELSQVHAQQQAAFDKSFEAPFNDTLQFDFSRL